jgi:hypothetical protein
MPELLPHWEHLVELSGGDEQVARMLSLYRPTPFLAGCSQAVWSRTRPMRYATTTTIRIQLGHERVEIG